jgi:hypothetical protein
MRVPLGGFAQATVAEQLQARCPYGACSNEAGGVYRHYAECPVENVAADHSRAGATGQHRL